MPRILVVRVLLAALAAGLLVGGVWGLLSKPTPQTDADTQAGQRRGSQQARTDTDPLHGLRQGVAYAVKNADHDFYLDVRGYSNEKNTQVFLYKQLHKQPNQRWYVEKAGADTVRLRSAQPSRYCLRPESDQLKSETGMVQGECEGDYSRWRVVYRGGSYMLLNMASVEIAKHNKPLALSTGRKESDGQRLEYHHRNDTRLQQFWNFTPLS